MKSKPISHSVIDKMLKCRSIVTAKYNAVRNLPVHNPQRDLPQHMRTMVTLTNLCSCY